MKINCFVCLMLLISSFISDTSGFPQAGNDLEIGDQCTLKSGIKGKCALGRNCPYVIDLFRKKMINEVVRCGFFKKDPIFCCKETSELTARAPILCEGSRPPFKLSLDTLEDHIVNGERADISEFPHMAALGYESETITSSYEFRCGGTLISKDFVLTAAHCINRRDTKPVIVRLGKTSLRDDSDKVTGQDIRISKLVIHRDYSSKSKQNDIALLKLEEPAVFMYNVWPACLSSDVKGPLKELEIIGFGVVETETRQTSDWLLKAKIDEFPLASCQESYRSLPGNPAIINGQVCAHNTKIFSDTCQGDSGGPMTYKKNNRFYVYGITSYGQGCGSSFPSVYTRVDQYLDWITIQMNL